MPIEDQKKLLKPLIAKKKYQVEVQFGQKVRFMYGDDPAILESYAKANGAKILKVTKL